MRSIIGSVLNRTPVPLSNDKLFLPVDEAPGGAMEVHLGAMEAQSTLFAIIDRLATSVAATGWGLYREGTRDLVMHTGGQEIDRHPALSVWNSPNRHTTRSELIEGAQQHMELVGEKWILMARSESLPNGPPIELWLVRPDRMAPIPHRTKFISGYTYKVGREVIPLGLDEVLYSKRPNPRNPYRGLAPIGALLPDIEGETAAASWNTQYFRNGAEPGGVLQVPDLLSDSDFETLNERWNQQHRGVRNAHRVAIFEMGEYKPTRISYRDMQFEQLRRYSREQFRNAYGFPKALLGDVEDVNRANAEAAEVVFARWLLTPRLNRWREMLNDDFLPAFGSVGQGWTFDYDDPVPVVTESAEPALDLASA